MEAEEGSVPEISVINSHQHTARYHHSSYIKRRAYSSQPMSLYAHYSTHPPPEYSEKTILVSPHFEAISDEISSAYIYAMYPPICVQKPEMGSVAAENLGLFTGVGALFWPGVGGKSCHKSLEEMRFGMPSNLSVSPGTKHSSGDNYYRGK
jgi:hypothetical protein